MGGLAAVALGACGAGKQASEPHVAAMPERSVSAPIAAVVAPVTAAVAPTPKAPCAVLAEIAEVARRTFPEDSAGAVTKAPCVPAKHGAFSVVVSFDEDATSGYGPGYYGMLELLFADDDGRVFRSRRIRVEESSTGANRYEIFGVADYDSDGTDELLIDESDYAFEANGDYHSEIWHVADGRLETYSPAAKLAIMRFVDIDGDVLPDLQLATPFQGTIDGCGPDGSYIEFGPKWVMRRQPNGAFAYDDVSRAEVRRACSAVPQGIVRRNKNEIDNAALRERLACAVAWGVPADVIVNELRRECPKLKQPLPDCPGELERTACLNEPQLAKWAAEKPPFYLR